MQRNHRNGRLLGGGGPPRPPVFSRVGPRLFEQCYDESVFGAGAPLWRGSLRLRMEELPLTIRLVVLIFLLCVNAFFAAAEVALVSVRETRVRELADAGNRGAQAVLDLLANPGRMISATQLGVTLASLGLGWAGEDTVFRLMEPVFRPLVPHYEQLAHVLSFVVAFTVITFLHMVIGEVVPKNLALERTEKLVLVVAPPLQLFSRVTGLFVTLVETTSERLSRLMGLKMAVSQTVYTAEELKIVVSLSQRQGALARLQEAMLHRVIDFYEVSVREVMVPRQEMIALPHTATIEQVVDCVVRYRHSRIPIYEQSPEQVRGVIYAKEIWLYVQQVRRWQLLDRAPPPFTLRSFMHDVAYVPETKFLFELLNEFLERRFHMAMVVDEFGTVVGLVTVEDALEQIVGEIRDEHERKRLPEALSPDQVFEVDGITKILDLDSEYQIELPYDAGFETLAGFLLQKLGVIPKGGETVTHGGHVFTILEMDHNRISRVRIEPAAMEEVAAPNEAAGDTAF
jgi:magnesium and cobalt exporter, CNNM family